MTHSLDTIIQATTIESLKGERTRGSAAEAPVAGASPLRVLHVHSGNLYGGVETMLLAQARGRDLCPALENSFALCFAGRLSRELTGAGARVHWLGEARIRQPLTVRRARRNLRELLQRHSFDVAVMHSCWAQAIFAPVVRAAGVPLVFYLHNPTDGRHWLERLARRTAPDAVLCNSEYTAATLARLYPRAHAEVVYCPVASPTNNARAEAAATRAELQTHTDAIVIIQVSRMESWKGHALHLEALGLLKDVPGWVCWQVGGAQRPGEEKYLRELKALAHRLGIAERVRFIGERSDVANLLAAADIFCQPNTAPEPFGIVFIEALYARLPIVATSIGGALEIVNDACGMLVEPRNALALAEALRRLIQERTVRARLGAGGPERARELCDPAIQMTRFREALTRVVCERQVSG